MRERLNTKFITDYQQLIDDCNKWVCPVQNIGGIWTFPIRNGEFTIAYPGDDAFMLHPAGNTSIVTFNTRELSHLTVERFTLSYHDAQSYLAGTFSLLPYIKNALDSIHQAKGFSHNQLSWGDFYLTFNRPGQEGEIFREMENQAAFELRACSNSIRPAMNLKVNNE